MQSKSDTVLSVKQAYYNVLQTTHLVDVFSENLKAQTGHVAQAQARKDVGVAPQADVLKAKAAEASARVDLVTAQKNANLALVALCTAIGVDPQSAIKISESSEPVPANLDQGELVKLALARRPELIAGKEQVLAAQAALKLQRTGNLPAITTTINDSQQIGARSSGSTVTGGRDNTWEWMLNLQWSPYDSGFTAGGVRIAKAQLVSAQEALYGVRQTVTQDVVNALLSVNAADEQLTSAIAEVASAKENRDVATGRYDAGVGILLDVFDAQALLLKAEVDEYTARYGLSSARAALQHAIGNYEVEGINHAP
jgi:outer membrane protein TolC